MSPRKKKKPNEPEVEGIFHGMVVYLVRAGVQTRRLQVWTQKLSQMGSRVEEDISKETTHILSLDSGRVLHEFGHDRLKSFKGKILHFQWLEDCLKSGEKLSEENYTLKLESDRENESDSSIDTLSSQSIERNQAVVKNSRTDFPERDKDQMSDVPCKHDIRAIPSAKTENRDYKSGSVTGEHFASSPGSFDNSSYLYSPPDLNRNITEVFGKLITIYRALGDDRRSFSYHKAIPVIEKLPFKIESVDQVKDLPAIGKSMQDHINEIVTTRKLSKLEHFENDEKVRAVTLFGEVWGIGPATALKLYEKGHRTLSDLEMEDSLTNAQRLGLKYFADISKKIPRDEVKEMEVLLKEAGENVLPGVEIVCGGSYRRGKASCGDLDIIITHPDGQSHKGFLPKYVQHLKEMKFLREDLVFSVHSIEGTDSGVDTYFGLCTYAGREQRHRIDFKVYPREIYAYGLIAWTGNNVLNRRLRLLAESKGYRLDDTGLFFATQASGGKRSAKSPSISCRTENEVFDVLGYPWLEPHERNL